MNQEMFLRIGGSLILLGMGITFMGLVSAIFYMAMDIFRK